MRQAVLVIPLLLVTLACSGLIPADTPVSDAEPEGDGPARTPPSGDVVPIGIVELALEGNGRCGITLETLPGGEETRLGSFAPLCPTEALVTWTGDRVVVEQSYVVKADIEKSGASHDH